MAVCLVGIHAYFGIQVLARKVIFVDLALAQIAALGATVAFMLGHPAQSSATYGYSLAFTLLAAVLLAFTRAWGTRVPQEALIGVIYVVAAAAAILLIDRAPQGAEHLKQILTGNILTSGLDEVAVIVPLYAAVGLLHWLLRRRLTGAGSLVWEFVFYATFGVVVTSSVAIAGVLLVFSFLIIPAAIGVMFALVAGTAARDRLDCRHAHQRRRPCRLFCLRSADRRGHGLRFWRALAVAGVLYPFLRGNRHSALRVAIATTRWSAAAILAGSALQLAAAPRADQPLIDMVEYAVPSLRTLYFTRAEQHHLCGCQRICGALPYRGRAAERFGKTQPHRRRGARRLQRRANFLVPEILRRNAQGRAIRHGRSARAGARARSMEREFGPAGVGIAVCPSSLAAPVGTSTALGLHRQSAPPRIGVSGNGIGSAVLFARTKHRGDWSEMRQLKISLTDDLRRQLAKVSAAAGHSLALEIRRRLQRTLEQDGSDPQTGELIAAIHSFAALVNRETGHAWHTHAGANEAFRRAIDLRVSRRKPSGSAAFEAGSLPARRSVTANTHDPVMMGHLIEVFDLRLLTNSEMSQEDSETKRRRKGIRE